MGGRAPVDPPKPQYYQVTCGEGHVIKGERAEGYQALRCPHCGDGVFVLPRSPLPLPAAPATARVKPKPAPIESELEPIEWTDAPAQHAADGEEIQWVEPARAESASPDRGSRSPSPSPQFDPEEYLEPIAAASAKPARARRPRAAVAAGLGATETAAPTRPSPAGPGQIVVPTRKKRHGQIASVIAAVTILAIITGYIRLQRNRLAELPHEAEVNAAEGKEALENGRFDEANVKLGKAARAYAQLKASDDAAMEAIQLASEASILANLDHEIPKEIVEEVARLGDPAGLEKFAISHKGRTVLIEAEVKTAKPVVELEYVILVGRGPTPAKTGRLDLSDFGLLRDRVFKEHETVIFGAVYKAIWLEGGEWRISFEPDSGVWMTNSKALARGRMEIPPP